MALFIATRGASHPWLTVPTVPDAELGAYGRQSLRTIRATLRRNAERLGEPCALRAVVLDACPDTKGRRVVALVVSDSGRVGKVFDCPTLAGSIGLALEAAEVAERRSERMAYLRQVQELDSMTAEHGAPGAPRALFTEA